MTKEDTEHEVLKNNFTHMREDFDKMTRSIEEMTKGFSDLKTVLIENYISRNEFHPANFKQYVQDNFVSNKTLSLELGLMKRIVYGAVGIILVSALTALVSLIIKQSS